MPQIIENDDIPGIQRLIHRLSAAEGISIYAIADRSGVHPTTLYAILKKRPTATTRPVRRETIRALAEGNRYALTFDAVKKRVILEKSGAEPGPRNGVEDLLQGLRVVLQRAGKREFAVEEKRRILTVVKALVS